MRAILIDDELSSLESLRFELAAYCPDVTIMGEFTDPRQAFAMLTREQPDILFLDIEMPHMNGFQLLENLPAISFDVIFITAYDEYALRAFTFNAADYLVKPILSTNLVQAVSRVRDRKTIQPMTGNTLQALITNAQAYPGGLENIAFPTSEGFEFVHVNDILYLQAESNYTWVFLANGTRHLIARTLKDMSAMIPYPQFFRSHQSYYVNLNHAQKFIRGQGGYLVLRNGTQIPVSRANRENLMIKLNL